jgi:tyrosine-protein kinase
VTVARTDQGPDPVEPGAPGSAWTPRRRGGEGAGPYLRALRTNWLLIVEIVAVAAVVAGLYATFAGKRYQAEADLVVTPISADDPAYVGVNVLRDSAQGSPVITAATLVSTPRVVAAAGVRGHVARSEAQAAVTANPLIQSNIVAVTAQASSPALAARLANAFAAATVAERTREYRASITAVTDGLDAQLQSLPASEANGPEATAIDQRLAELASLSIADPSVRVLSPAVAPASPVWPRKTLIVGAAVAVALIIGIGIALAREFLTQRVSEEDEFLLEQRLPVLTRVPRMRTADAEGYLTMRSPLPPEMWESYRTLRVLLHRGTGRRTAPKTILVTSAVAGEAKTMTAVNLAVTMAQAGERVVLVDGDVRRPMVASVFGAPADDTDVWQVPGHGDRLGLVAALPGAVRPEGVVDAAALRRWFAGLLRRVDVVVVDSAPITEAADTLELGSAADTVLLSVRLGVTRRDRFEDARALLSLRGIVPAGLVLTTRTRGRRDLTESRRIAPAEAGGEAPQDGADPAAEQRNGHRPEGSVPAPGEPGGGGSGRVDDPAPGGDPPSSTPAPVRPPARGHAGPGAGKAASRRRAAGRNRAPRPPD